MDKIKEIKKYLKEKINDKEKISTAEITDMPKKATNPIKKSGFEQLEKLSMFVNQNIKKFDVNDLLK